MRLVNKEQETGAQRETDKKREDWERGRKGAGNKSAANLS